MADWYDTITDEWRAVALATLIEIPANNYFTVVQSLRKNILVNAIKAIGGKTGFIAPPYIIQQVGVDSVPQDSGPDGRYYDLPTRIWYVIDKVPDSDEAGLDTPAYCRSRMELLRVALQTPATLTKCQWLGGDGIIDSSEASAFAEENMVLFAAELTFENGFRTLLT